MANSPPAWALAHVVDGTTKKTTFPYDVEIDGNLTATIGNLGALSTIVGGATSLSLRNNANTLDNLIITDAGNATLRGSLAFAAASSVITPGATSLTIKNNAGSVNNYVFNNNGQLAIGAGTSASTANLFTFDNAALPNDTASYLSVSIVAQNAGTGNQLTNTKRILGVQGTMSGAFTQGTYAAIYGTATNSGTGGIVHHIGTVGEAAFTGNVVLLANSISAGLYGFITASSGTPSIDRAIGVWSAPLTGAGGLTANIYAGFWAAGTSVSAYTITDAYGIHCEMPSGASGNNMGVQIGTRFTATATVGLHVGSGGSWFRGVATVPPADTANTAAQIVIWAGSNAGANDTQCTLHFYRSSATPGFIGYDSNTSQVLAGHTKLVGDLVLGHDTCVVDTNGQIWSSGSINGNSMSIVPTARTSGAIGTSFTYTGAAHTGLTPANFAEFSFNAQRTVTFDGTGSPTIASAYTFNFLAPTYTASTAVFTATLAATLRVAGAPAVSAGGGFTPVLTNTWAILVAAGASSFGGAIVQGHATTAINSTNTMTVAAALNGYITSTSAAPTTITLPTGTNLGAALGAVQGTIHDIYIDNTAGANTVTIAVAVNGILSADAAANAASAGLLTVPSGVTGQACFRLMFSSATAYTFTRIA